MRELAIAMAVGAVIGGIFFFVARRFIQLACAMKRLRDAARRRDVTGGTACSVCRGASTTTGPVFQMRSVRVPPQGMLERIREWFMPERIRVMLPMCPECHIRLIRFDFWCTAVMLGWCLAFLAVFALLLFMPRNFLALDPDVWFRPEVVLAYAFMPISLHVLLVMPRYYKSIIAHPLIVEMVQRGYLLSNRNKAGQEIESCDWVEVIGDASSAPTQPA